MTDKCTVHEFLRDLESQGYFEHLLAHYVRWEREQYERMGMEIE